MAKKLTALAIENLKPGEKRREVPDGDVGGLYHIIQPSGARSWAYRYRFHGRPRKFTFAAADLKSARTKANEAKAEIANGIDPGLEKKAARAAELVADRGLDCIDTIVPRFVEQHAKRNLKASTAREVERVLTKEVVAPWHGRRLTMITRADVHALLDNIVERGSPVSANRALAWLRRLCAWAVERDVLAVSPCAGIKRPSAERARVRVLCDRELAAVWRAADRLDAPAGAFVRLLVLTGQRRGEVAGMAWSEIDINAKLWVLPGSRSKNANEHTIPLSDSAIKVLSAIRNADDHFVFSVPRGVPIRGFDLIKTRLDAAMPPDTPPWVLHDLRRTFASGCARLDVPIHVLEACLNHRSGAISGVAAVYNRHDYHAGKVAAMDAWSRYVEQIVSAE